MGHTARKAHPSMVALGQPGSEGGDNKRVGPGLPILCATPINIGSKAWTPAAFDRLIAAIRNAPLGSGARPWVSRGIRRSQQPYEGRVR